MTTVTEHLTVLIDDCLAAWSAHDIDRLTELFAADCTVEDIPLGQLHHGTAGVRYYAQQVFAGFPDLRLTPEAITIGGDRATVQWIMTGTQTGAVHGLPPLGQPCHIRGVSSLTLGSDRLASCISYWDMMTLLWQLGHSV